MDGENFIRLQQGCIYKKNTFYQLRGTNHSNGERTGYAIRSRNKCRWGSIHLRKLSTRPREFDKQSKGSFSYWGECQSLGRESQLDAGCCPSRSPNTARQKGQASNTTCATSFPPSEANDEKVEGRKAKESAFPQSNVFCTSVRRRTSKSVGELSTKSEKPFWGITNIMPNVPTDRQ